MQYQEHVTELAKISLLQGARAKLFSIFLQSCFVDRKIYKI